MEMMPACDIYIAPAPRRAFRNSPSALNSPLLASMLTSSLPSFLLLAATGPYCRTHLRARKMGNQRLVALAIARPLARQLAKRVARTCLQLDGLIFHLLSPAVADGERANERTEELV